MTQSIRLGVPTPNKLLALRGITRLALVTPYTAELQQPMVDSDRAIGSRSRSSPRQLVICVNRDLAIVATGRLPTMVGEIAEARPQAITNLCTNLRAAPLAEFVEAKLGIPLLDTVRPPWGSCVPSTLLRRRCEGGAICSASDEPAQRVSTEL